MKSSKPPVDIIRVDPSPAGAGDLIISKVRYNELIANQISSCISVTNLTFSKTVVAQIDSARVLEAIKEKAANVGVTPENYKFISLSDFYIAIPQIAERKL
jgi:hypothetical protein